MSAAESRPALWKRLLRFALLSLIALSLALLIGEGALRFLLFSDSPLAQKRGKKLRKADKYADIVADPEYWKLRYMFGDPQYQKPPAAPDTFTGWNSGWIKPNTYQHRMAAKLGEHQPVLLFGDSFAECTTGPELCFQGLMESDPLGERFFMLNYGAGGYGFDQIILSLSRGVRPFRGTDAVVIVSLLIDNDLDRCVLDFRSWPKPYFSLEDGELELHTPDTLDGPEYIERHPPQVTSYLWRYFIYGTKILPPHTRHRLKHMPEKFHYRRDLSLALLDRLKSELDGLKLPFFFLIFHGPALLANPERDTWQENLVVTWLENRGMPYVSSKDYLLRAAAAQSVPPGTFFFTEGLGKNHYTPEGNRIVFEAIRDGLAGQFPGPVEERYATRLSTATQSPR